MVDPDIPEFLMREVMFKRQIQIGYQKHESFQIVLTFGPQLYVTKDKQILGCCDLRKTQLAGLICQQTDFTSSQSSSKILKSHDFDVCFTYANGKKQVFFLLKMTDKLCVMTKHDNEILLKKEYTNVRMFKVIENVLSTVHLRIERTNETVECDELYRVIFDHPMVDEEHFCDVYATISERIALARAELSTTKFQLQKYFHELGQELRFGPKALYDVIEERVKLAIYGDVWIRRHNEMLVFGVPVYNCCFKSKKLVENIRAVLISDKLDQFEFSYKLHYFHVDERAVPDYDAILSREDTFTSPSFDQEWLSSEKNNLQPDTAAIVVIKTIIPSFVDFETLEYDCFLQYEIDNGIQLQNFIGRITIDTDILYEQKFLVTFNKDNVYKDLLTVTSTSECIFIKLVFINVAVKEHFYDFLLNYLKFSKINDTPEDDALADKFDFLSTSIVEQHLTDMYFLREESNYWTSTLIRTESKGLVDKQKIYNKCKDKILLLVQCIRKRFDKNIVMEFINPKCDEIKLSELKHAYQEEMAGVNNNVDPVANLINELRTDTAYLAL